MKRRLLNLLTVISLLLCVAVAVLWVRSHFVSEWVSRRAASRDGDAYHLRYRTVYSANGRIIFHSVSGTTADARFFGPEERRLYFRHQYKSQGWAGWVDELSQLIQPRLGFGAALRRRPLTISDRTTWVGTDRFVMIPHWSVVAPLALLPLVWLRRAVRMWLRLLRRRCPACGYSLTGNVSGVCPECGRATA